MNRFVRGEYVNIIVRNARTHIEEERARFTDYEVEIKTNHMAFTVKHSQVRRRYSDFVWLRSRLAKDLMTSDPPILPGRKLFGRFNTDFITQRQRRLQDFLSKVVKNNVFLSHAALHLFLQSKMTVEEIEEHIDSKNDEAPYETILSESAFKVSLHPNETSFSTKDPIPTKQDSGIESSHDPDSGDSNIAIKDAGEEQDVLVSDGNTADSEDNADENEVSDDNDNTDEDQLEDRLGKLRLPSLPSLPQEMDMESSIEYLLSASSDSNDEVIPEDAMHSGSSDLKSPSSRNSPQKSRNRPRRRRTCIAQFDLPESSTAKGESLSSSLKVPKKTAPIRRCYSFERSIKPFHIRIGNFFSGSKQSDNDFPSRKTSKNSLSRSSSSRCFGSEERFRSKLSSSEERFRSPSKQKISLNEYCILKGDNIMQGAVKENDFNSSL